MGRGKPKSSKNNLNEIDVNVFLNDYFDNFKQNLRNNNFDKMNTLLVNNIVDKFDIIFQLWDENRIFQGSVDKKRFENIYESMANVFGAEIERSYEPIISNDFTLECNHCGEAFPLRNKDCRYSYDLHAISKEHRDFVENLNIDEGDADILLRSTNYTLDKYVCQKYEPEPKKPNPLESFDTVIVRASRKQKQNPKVVIPQTPTKKKNKTAKIKKAVPASNSESISAYDASCITFQNNALLCKICDVKLNPKSNIFSHMIGKLHQQSTIQQCKSSGIFMMRDKNGMHCCNLCKGYSCAKMNTLVHHCQTNVHTKKANEFESKSNIKLSDRLFEYVIPKILFCPILSCSSSVTKFEELLNHLQSIHQIK